MSHLSRSVGDMNDHRGQRCRLDSPHTQGEHMSHNVAGHRFSRHVSDTVGKVSAVVALGIIVGSGVAGCDNGNHSASPLHSTPEPPHLSRQVSSSSTPPHTSPHSLHPTGISDHEDAGAPHEADDANRTSGSDTTVVKASRKHPAVFQGPNGTIVCQFRGMETDGCNAYPHPQWGEDHRCPYPGVGPSFDTMIGFRHGPRAEPCHWLLQGVYPKSGQTLPYGHSIAIHVHDTVHSTYTCTSQAQGMICTSDEGHGFVINSTQYRTG